MTLSHFNHSYRQWNLSHNIFVIIYPCVPSLRLSVHHPLLSKFCFVPSTILTGLSSNPFTLCIQIVHISVQALATHTLRMLKPFQNLPIDFIPHCLSHNHHARYLQLLSLSILITSLKLMWNIQFQKDGVRYAPGASGPKFLLQALPQTLPIFNTTPSSHPDLQHWNYTLSPLH